MENIVNFDDVNTKIITIRNQNVILDSLVAELYGVETKRVNEAVKNNPDKFPEGYVFQLQVNEFHNLRALFEKSKVPDNQDAVENTDHTLTINTLIGGSEKTTVMPKAFTEKGLYMLATILKSPRAVQTTIAIVETFAKLRELSSSLIALSTAEAEVIEPEVIEKTGSLFNEVFFSGVPTSAETSLEFNIGFMKGKRSVKSEANPTLQDTLERLERRIGQLEKSKKH